MSKPKNPPVMRLCELEVNQYADFFAQLADKKRSTTRDGKPYYSCKFRDNKRTVSSVPIWSDSPFFEECQTRWQPGGYFKLRATYSEHEKYGPQIDIDQIRVVDAQRDAADGFSEFDFIDRSHCEPDAMYSDLMALVVSEIKDDHLRQLVMMLLETHAAAIKSLPATPTKFYRFTGGWLEHTLSVTRNCLFLADRYITQFPLLNPPLNRDLVIAGAVLHDIGRIKELEGNAHGAVPRPGIDGELFGHLLLGVEMIRDAAREVPELNPELLRLLLHIVHTHLELPEWGSPRLPRIPEVLIIHHADDLDAKFEMYARCLTRDDSDGPFTDRDPVLRRPLLKGRTV